MVEIEDYLLRDESRSRMIEKSTTSSLANEFSFVVQNHDYHYK
jgi:hypothetical protein